MGSDEYTVVGGGGALKLKGAKVQKRKKKKPNKSDLGKNLETGEKQVVKRLSASDDTTPADDHSDNERPIAQKTESEKRHDEIKKKRLLQMAESRPELIKTHKERVEELNSYLSKLSEHHDMPKIGPG